MSTLKLKSALSQSDLFQSNKTEMIDNSHFFDFRQNIYKFLTNYVKGV